MLSNHTQEIRECYQQAAHGALCAASWGSKRPNGAKTIFRAYAALATIGPRSDRLHRYATNHHRSRATIVTAMGVKMSRPARLLFG